MTMAWPLWAGALALAMPHAPAATHTVRAQICGAGGVAATVAIPLLPAFPPDDPSCKPACHALCDRRDPARSSGDGEDEGGS